jgi:thymidylate synthase (FAD)
MKIVHESSVEFIDSMGGDLRVADAARVSFDKKSEWEYDDVGNEVLKPADAKLINYLARHHHWTPFSHVIVQLRMTVPIFVARQLDKHQVGATRNEISRRYVDTEPAYFIPKVWRQRAENKKQGSGDNFDEPDNTYFSDQVLTHVKSSLDLYTFLIDSGVAPEQARMVLPQQMMTSYYWTGSLAFWARLHSLRAKPDAQQETQDVAALISGIVSGIAPVSWKALTTTNE